MVPRMNMSAGSAGRELRTAHHQIITPAKRGRGVTTTPGVLNHGDGRERDISGTTVPHRPPLRRKCVKKIGEGGTREDAMTWPSILENMRRVETEHFNIYEWTIGVWVRSLWLAPKKQKRPKMDLLAHTGLDIYIPTVYCDSRKESFTNGEQN